MYLNGIRQNILKGNEEFLEILDFNTDSVEIGLTRNDLQFVKRIKERVNDCYGQFLDMCFGDDVKLMAKARYFNYNNPWHVFETTHDLEEVMFLELYDLEARVENIKKMILEEKEGIINLTPHVINVNNRIIPSHGLARCSEIVDVVDTFDNIDIIKKTFGEVTGLPKYRLHTRFVVSIIVKLALPDRSDILVPGEIIRDDQGKIIGCKNLAM